MNRGCVARSGPFAGAFVRSAGRGPARELRRIAEETQSGLQTSPEQRKTINRCIEQLQECGAEQTTTGSDMSATWKMLWTTEKETLFILKNCRIFGKASGDVFQVIDTEEGTLQNIIELEPESIFGVDASIDIASPQRVNFKFLRAFYREGNKPPFNLPPFGQGWFENVYLDDEIRVAKDIRKDTLVTVRQGPPRVFS